MGEKESGYGGGEVTEGRDRVRVIIGALCCGAPSTEVLPLAVVVVGGGGGGVAANVVELLRLPLRERIRLREYGDRGRALWCEGPEVLYSAEEADGEEAVDEDGSGGGCCCKHEKGEGDVGSV